MESTKTWTQYCKDIGSQINVVNHCGEEFLVMVKNKENVLKSLGESLGIVSNACSKNNVTRTTFYKWCKNDPKFREAVDDIRERQIDIVESMLMRKIIEEHDTASIIFYLKCRAKHRGYCEHLAVIPVSGKQKVCFEDFRSLFVEDIPVKRVDVSRVTVDPKLLKKTNVNDEETMILEEIND